MNFEEYKELDAKISRILEQNKIFYSRHYGGSVLSPDVVDVMSESLLEKTLDTQKQKNHIYQFYDNMISGFTAYNLEDLAIQKAIPPVTFCSLYEYLGIEVTEWYGDLEIKANRNQLSSYMEYKYIKLLKDHNLKAMYLNEDILIVDDNLKLDPNLYSSVAMKFDGVYAITGCDISTIIEHELKDVAIGVANEPLAYAEDRLTKIFDPFSECSFGKLSTSTMPYDVILTPDRRTLYKISEYDLCKYFAIKEDSEWSSYEIAKQRNGYIYLYVDTFSIFASRLAHDFGCRLIQPSSYVKTWQKDLIKSAKHIKIQYN